MDEEVGELWLVYRKCKLTWPRSDGGEVRWLIIFLIEERARFWAKSRNFDEMHVKQACFDFRIHYAEYLRAKEAK